MSRTKSVLKWIESDPLRAKYWINGCPNCDMDDMLGFIREIGNAHRIVTGKLIHQH